MGISKYIYIASGVLILALSGAFYFYYNSSQEELKALYGDIEKLRMQKIELTEDINKQTEEIEKKAKEINKKQEQIRALEIERSKVREENSKLKIKLDKHNLDKIVLSSESRKKKVERILKESTFKELSELEELSKKIQKKINKE